MRRGFDWGRSSPFLFTSLSPERASETDLGTVQDKLLSRALRFFFTLLYHEFAWSYDLVAAVVSLGRWKDWIHTAAPFIQGPRVLELAFGSGMLQESLGLRKQALVLGIDESPQMCRLAKRRLGRAGLSTRGLTRGVAEQLPFAGGAFSTVVATFPNEFIIDPQTLAEARRVLAPAGRFIVLPVAWIVGSGLLDRAAAALFRVTHQAPRISHGEAAQRLMRPLEQAGFSTTIQMVELRQSAVLILIASK